MNNKWTYFVAGLLVGVIVGSGVFFAVASSHYGVRGGLLRESGRMMGRGDGSGRPYQRDDIRKVETPTSTDTTLPKPEAKLPAAGTGSIPPEAK